MSYITTFETYETRAHERLFAKRSIPAAPFPRKHVLSVFVDEQDAQQAAEALFAAGFDERGIYVLNNGDFTEAMMRNQSPFDFLTSMDYDVYLREASQKRFFLAVRPTSHAQLQQIRDLLAPHHTYLVRYIDTWALTELLP